MPGSELVDNFLGRPYPSGLDILQALPDTLLDTRLGSQIA